jgi:MSHA pilin protein MshA
MTSKYTESGFTLIELIIVIVILGVLAVTAAPRFIDLQSDAEAAALEGIQSALSSANQLIFAKALIQGQHETEDGTVTLEDGTSVATRYGYIAFSGAFSGNDIRNSLNVDICHHNHNAGLCSTGDSSDYIYDVDQVNGSPVVRLFHGRRFGTDRGADDDQIECRLDYIMPTTAGELPNYQLFTTEC